MTPTSSVRRPDVEIEGEEVATGFHVDDNAVPVRCWKQVTDTSGVADKVLADECEMSRGHYSKVASGAQGDLLGLVYRVGKRRPGMRRAFIALLAEHEGVDPVTAAAEHLLEATVRFLRVRGLTTIPKPHMAKAST